MTRRASARCWMCLLSGWVGSGLGFALQSGPGQNPPASASTPLPPAVSSGLRAPGPQFRVTWEAGKLSVDAQGTPLSELLQAICGQTGLEVTGLQGLSNPVFAHFAGMDLIPALRKLLSRVDYAIAAGPSGSASLSGKLIVVKAGSDLGRGRSPVKSETLTATPPVEAPEALPDPEPQAALDAELQEKKRTAIDAAALGRDGDALRKYLRDADTSIQTAAFDALAAQGKAAALEGLVADINDTTQPTRLQSIQLLVQSADAGDQTLRSTLRDALNDPDPSFSAYAVQVLAGRGDAEAIDTLRQALRSADPAARLMIIQGAGQMPAGSPLLREAMADPDEAVSSAAAALLNNQTGAADPSGKP